MMKTIQALAHSHIHVTYLCLRNRPVGIYLILLAVFQNLAGFYWLELWGGG